ncbi:ubiquitin-like domain-containing protein [uncultured Jatrophihabitans sp.]|uniref:aggregation-promoting factor C-terminal-like domain-containing protein n=1 Tax=uncultured Jatrophihabitans sp. TaxID=1610747 RepID=UPI0035CC02B9
MLRSLKYGLHGAVLAGLVAAPLVWSSVDKDVHLSIDGRTTTVSTTASNVGQVLRSQHYRIDGHDLVAPAAGAKVKDGMTVVLRHGRLLRLDINGKRTSVWTTASTVQEALSQLGYTTSDYVSVSRSRRLPLSPTDVAIRTPKVVTVVHDGTRERVSTTDATVAQLLADIDVTVHAKDKVSAQPGSALASGQVVVVQRVGDRTEVKSVAVDFTVTRTADSTLAAGKTKVVSKGKKGRMEITYSVVYVDGKPAARVQLSSRTMSAPRPEVLAVGTKQASDLDAMSTPQVTGPTPGSAKAIALELAAKRGWGDDQYSCLVQMWTRESGWRTNAANPSGAYGIPQALPGSKMASAGADWQTSAETQIKWGLGYIAARYNTPCGAWAFWQAHNYY